VTGMLSNKISKAHTIKNQTNHILPGFEKINRFWCRQLNMEMVKILPGEFYVTTSDEIIATVLGSCISVCIRDAKLGIGGMNHFMLPENNKKGDDSWKYNKIDKAARYGSDAMEHLVNELLKNGARKKHFEIKITGGGRIMAQMNDIGRKNIAFIKDYLETEGYTIASEDVGEIYPRKVRYFPKTGRLQVKKLRSLHNDTVINREKDYKKHIEEEKIEGDIELF
jgi:chemotaxis protein CheD